jgi:hypothetical protein
MPQADKNEKKLMQTFTNLSTGLSHAPGRCIFLSWTHGETSPYQYDASAILNNGIYTGALALLLIYFVSGQFWYTLFGKK